MCRPITRACLRRTTSPGRPRTGTRSSPNGANATSQRPRPNDLKNLAAAQKLMDWAASDAAMALYAKNFAIVAVQALSQPLPNVPANYASLLAKNDFAWAASNRDKILAEWSKRYESKAAPK